MTGSDDAVISEAMVLIATVSPPGTDLERIRLRLSRYRAEHGDVDLAEKVSRWAARARREPVRYAESALFKFLNAETRS